MSNKVDIPNENTSDFICRTNGDIAVNNVEKYKKSLNKQTKEENRNQFKGSYLLREWTPSKLKGYVSDEFKRLKFTN
jgi:hypothetical protein